MDWCCFKKSKTPSSLQHRYRPTIPVYDRSTFFVITTIFNPAIYQKRYDLYHQFAQHMKDTGAQLVTIECIFPSLNQHDFQVTQANNPLHIQMTSDSVYWMKENLINIAVLRLPPSTQWVCWLDADIYFHELKGQNWIDMTIAALQKYTIVQIFKRAHFLGPDGQVLRTDYSFGYSVVHQKPIDQDKYNEWYPHPGYGWAMAKSTFLEIGGLPDYDIVGSGDLHFAFSLLNKVSNAIEGGLNEEFKQMIVERSTTVFQNLKRLSRATSMSMVGYVPLTISHFWHGSRKNRQYVGRWKILIHHQFNFWRDMRTNWDGLLQLMGENKDELQADIQAHFQMRREDGVELHEEDEQNLRMVEHPRRPKNGKKDKRAAAGKKGKRQGQGHTFGPVGHHHHGNNGMVMAMAASSMYQDQGHSYGHGGEPTSNYCNDYNGTVTCSSQY